MLDVAVNELEILNNYIGQRAQCITGITMIGYLQRQKNGMRNNLSLSDQEIEARKRKRKSSSIGY
jgi:hypothetical protein